MNSSLPSISLPDEAKAVIWRIFGLGESHIDRRSAYELIEETVKEHASSIDTNRGHRRDPQVGSNLMGINNGSSLKWASRLQP